jgi:electron transfer flavoprotein beta subunit
MSSGGWSLAGRRGPARSEGRNANRPLGNHPGRLNPLFTESKQTGPGMLAPAMKVAVCVKEVPDAAAPKRIDPQTFRLDRSGAAGLNEFDTHALEEGLRLKENGGAEEVVALLMGPARAADSLRKALAMGADRSVLVTDDAFAGSDLVATSRVLGKALEREGADLVLFGQQAGDSDGAVLWAAVADRLQLPMVSQAASLEIADGKAKVKRQTEYGYDVIETPLPCVVAVSDAINEPRYPSLKGIMGAKKKPQETLGASDLGVGADEAGENGSRTEVYALGDPPSRGDSRRIEDENGNAADAIVTYLQEKKLI